MSDFIPAVPGDLVVFRDLHDFRAGEVMRVDQLGGVLTMRPFGVRVSLLVPKDAEVRVEPQESVDIRALRMAKVNTFTSFDEAKKYLSKFKREG